MIGERSWCSVLASPSAALFRSFSVDEGRPVASGTASSAATNSAALWKRLSTSFSSAFDTTASSSVES